MKTLKKKLIIVFHFIFSIFLIYSCNEQKPSSSIEINLGIKHLELIGDYGVINSEGEYSELLLTENKIYNYNKNAGLISPKDYKYINDTLIRMRYGDYQENKYYDVRILKLSNRNIKCDHLIPTEYAKNNFQKILNVEILIPINGEEITMGDFFNKNTARFDEKMSSKLYRHFLERERKNVP